MEIWILSLGFMNAKNTSLKILKNVGAILLSFNVLQSIHFYYHGMDAPRQRRNRCLPLAWSQELLKGQYSLLEYYLGLIFFGSTGI
jgi:hypothetical protein